MVSGQDGFDDQVQRGGELLRAGQVGEARAAFRAALATRPGEVRALGLLGLCCFRLSAFDEALEVYRGLVAARPDDASYHLNLGLVHLKLGDARAAIDELSRCRELDPGESRTVGYLGLAYAREGLYRQAYEAFLRAGQPGLAREMEQYLGAEEREAIREAVASGRPVAAEGVPAARDDGAVAARDDGSAATSDPVPAGARAAEDDDAADGGEVDDDDVVDAREANERYASDADVVAVEDLAVLRVDEPEPEPGPSPTAAEGAEASAAPTERSLPVIDADSDVGEGAGVELGVPGFTGPGGLITRAVASAAPSAAASDEAVRVAPGHSAPRGVSGWATERLRRPAAGDGAIELSDDGALVVRVDGRLLSRTGGVIAAGGDLTYQRASRRVRGASSGQPFGDHTGRMYEISGRGYLVVAPGRATFTALSLDEDIVYLREDLVFAFEERLRWESGHVPGSDARIDVLQLRGQGAVALRSARPLTALAVSPERSLLVAEAALAGWIGRVVPLVARRVVGEPGDGPSAFVECTGEGVVLVELPGER